MHKYMSLAIEEAYKGMRKNKGGPFGAVIIRKGKVIAKAHNEVIDSKDPTAHAEIVAIRKASRKLKKFDLSDCTLYTSCEPCPMCFAAIKWAGIKKLFYGCKSKDAANIGFDDKHIYDLIKGKTKDKDFSKKLVNRKEALGPFKEWKSKKDKIHY